VILRLNGALFKLTVVPFRVLDTPTGSKRYESHDFDSTRIVNMAHITFNVAWDHDSGILYDVSESYNNFQVAHVSYKQIGGLIYTKCFELVFS